MSLCIYRSYLPNLLIKYYSCHESIFFINMNVQENFTRAATYGERQKFEIMKTFTFRLSLSERTRTGQLYFF
jgi:hypothetical protein